MEFEAKPHSAQADKVQIVVSKAYRSQILDESDIGELNLHRFTILLHNVKSAKSVAILRRNNLSIKIVGAGAIDSPLGGVILWFFVSLMPNFWGCIVVIFSVNSTGEICETSGAPSPTNALWGY